MLKRFYSKSLYFLNLEQLSSYIILFAFIFFVTFLCLEFINNRFENIINFFIYVFVYSRNWRLNLHIYTFIFTIIGVYSLFEKQKNMYIYLSLLFIGPFFWISNSNKYNYTLDLDKIVGFSSSSMDIHSTTYWSIIFF